jgi:hypothetical protein
MQRTRRHRRPIGRAAAMPLLRRQDDDHRDLRAWRPRPRAAMDERAMTTNPPSPHRMPAEDLTRSCVSGRSHVPHHRQRRNHPLLKRRSVMRTPVAGPSTYPFPSAKRIAAATTDQAETSNPHRLEAAIPTPRVPSLPWRLPNAGPRATSSR